MGPWWIGGLAGLLALDTRAVGRSLLGEPLFTGWLCGAALGDASLGLSIGAWFQLLWIHLLPEGAVTPPDGTVPTAVAVALVWYLDPLVALDLRALVMLVMVLTVPLGFISRWMEIHLKEGFGLLSEYADAAAHRGRLERFGRLVTVAIGLEWLKAAVLTSFAVVSGSWLLPRIIVSLPQPLCDGLALAYWFILPLGLAVSVEAVPLPSKFKLFLIAFLAMSVAYGVWRLARPWLLAAAVVGGVLYVVGHRRARGVLV